MNSFKCLIILATAFISFSAPASAEAATDAADCAAFNWAHWDYETENFDPEDRSEGWKDQARAFEAAARKKGMSATQVTTRVKQKRGLMKKMIETFIFSESSVATARFEAQSKTCQHLIETTPELRAFR